MIDDSVDLVSAVVSIIVFYLVVVFRRSGDGYTIYGRVKIAGMFLLFIVLQSSECFLIHGFKISVELLLFFFFFFF